MVLPRRSRRPRVRHALLVTMPACVPTAQLGCLSPSDYERKREEIAEKHENEPGFENQWGLRAINAAQAYADLELAAGFHVAAGAGVTVGFIDTGVDLEHPLFKTRMTEEFLLSSVDEHGGPLSHGTMVASVVAANAEGIADDDRIVPEDRHLGFRGIASGADVKVFAIDLWPTGANRAYNPATLEELGAYDPAITEIVSHVLSQDIDIVNVSVGFTGIVDNYTEEEIRTHFRNAIEKMAQGDATEKKILVWAAGNAHGTLCLPNVDNCVGGSTEPPLSLGTIDAVSVEFMPGLPARIEELRGHSIAAVAVGPDRDGDGYPEIASFSNRCGIAANWCIASPGEEVLLAEFGRKNAVPGSRGIGRHDGTSFAAPMVAGGLALMKQLFRGQIPNTELVERLFLTADKGGPYGNRAVYGQGMMDLGAATSPVGQVKLASGQSVDGRGYGLSSTFIRPGGAFGDSLMRSFAGREIVAFDSLGAPYWFGLSEFAEIDAGPSLSARLLSLLAHMPDREHDSARRTPALSRWIGAQDSPGRDAPRLQFGFLNAPSGAGDGHFSLARDALTVAVDDGDGLNVAALTTAGGARRSPVIRSRSVASTIRSSDRRARRLARGARESARNGNRRRIRPALRRHRIRRGRDGVRGWRMATPRRCRNRYRDSPPIRWAGQGHVLADHQCVRFRRQSANDRLRHTDRHAFPTLASRNGSGDVHGPCRSHQDGRCLAATPGGRLDAFGPAARFLGAMGAFARAGRRVVRRRHLDPQSRS